MMALAQRPGSRFFAAFYRWSRHTQRASPCALSTQKSHLSRRLPACADARSYHATCRLRAEDRSTHGFMQELERSAAAAPGNIQAPTGPPAQTVDSAKLREDVRHLMRKVPASVAVITVAHVDPETKENVPMGIAVSSLSTVTLDPPTISFNIKQPSQALDAIRDAHGRFRVHWLAGNSGGRSVIENFCKGNHPKAYALRREKLQIDLPRFEDNSTSTASLAPQIRGPAVRAAAECTMTHEFDVGDHVILVAQVTGLESLNSENPTIAYVDGAYRRLGLTEGIVGHHQNQQDPKQPTTQQQDAAPTEKTKITEKEIRSTLSRAHELSMAYDWPAIPGVEERFEYAERLRSYIKETQDPRSNDPRLLIKCLQPETRRLSRSIGIDLVSLTRECLSISAREVIQALPEFTGHLSPSTMAKLSNRMTQFVKADSKFLEVSYTQLLRYLGVHIGGSTVVPSDLLNPLRAEGILSSFEPWAVSRQKAGTSGNVFVMEQAEHSIRSQLSQLTDAEILRIPLTTILSQAKVSNANSVHFAESFVRLRVEACKSFDTQWRHDIAGELTPEEARVVIRRLVEYMGVDTREVYRERMFEDSYAMMRHIGVHPLILGINTDFLVSKVRYLYSTTEDFSNLQPRVDEMLQPYFLSNVTWEDLESRIEQFVQKLPLRATTWNTRDVLAAMGLSGHTLISTLVTETPNTIDESNLLDMLMAKALKSHYGSGTDEENQAIATCLKNRYGFDVTRKPTAVTPEQALKRSSADDLEEAMLQHRAETLPIRDVGT